MSKQASERVVRVVRVVRETVEVAVTPQEWAKLRSGDVQGHGEAVAALVERAEWVAKLKRPKLELVAQEGWCDDEQLWGE